MREKDAKALFREETGRDNRDNELSKERIGEIAFILVKQYYKDKGIPQPATFKRDLGNLVANTNILPEELSKFFQRVFHEMISEEFATKSQKQVTKGKVETVVS